MSSDMTGETICAFEDCLVRQRLNGSKRNLIVFAEYPGYYPTSDAGIIDDDGYVFIMSRTDDIINVAGHRLSTGAMEEIIASHSTVRKQGRHIFDSLRNAFQGSAFDPASI